MADNVDDNMAVRDDSHADMEAMGAACKEGKATNHYRYGAPTCAT
jgi:hypothetical protein